MNFKKLVNKILKRSCIDCKHYAEWVLDQRNIIPDQSYCGNAMSDERGMKDPKEMYKSVCSLWEKKDV